MTIKTETRELATDSIEIREANGTRMIHGYAVKWGMPSNKIGGRFFEQFQKGAFTESLAKHDIRALWSHDTSKVLGRTKNNTLRLTEDDVGLRFELDLPNTTVGNDTYESINRGDIDGVSFGFRAIQQHWEKRDQNNIVRDITKANLLEISPIGFPAYPDSQVSIRGYDPFNDYSEKQDLRKRLILKTYF
ncbi:HK97 family phage prohead protease [Metabacillus fastidiosus]|uniref:HK97 family phage prohead protease n=1 Tax=Metabacillus fastidiosus TaxID=1458 RepID=UPI003D2B27F5